MGKRVVAVVAVLALLIQLTGCTVKKTQRLDPTVVTNPAAETIIGITTKAGEELSFDPPGATVRDRVIHAAVNKKPYQIALEQVERLWVQRQEPSTARTIGLAVGLAVGTLVVVAAIVLATKESCPFVYSWDGEQYVFDAEPYGGSITRGLERDDFGELEHLRPNNGQYQLLITNEVEETQFTNLMELQVVDHRSERVVVTDQGRFHTLSSPQPPTAAKDQDGKDLLPWLKATDKRIWEPEAAPGTQTSVRQDIQLTFQKPPSAKKAKLVVNAATSLWGSYMIKAISELRGRDLESWYASMDSDPAAANALLYWTLREELFMLKICTAEPGGWEQRGLLLGGGPFIAEDRAVELDVSRVQGDQLSIRIRPPKGFWALNSFAVDYSLDEQVEVQNLKPIEAKDANGRDRLPELIAADKLYYEMPNIGDRAQVRFLAPAGRTGMKRTVFLHSRGYYKLHLKGTGQPDTEMLQQITAVPDAAARFAGVCFAAWRAAHTSRY